MSAIYRDGIATGRATFETETPSWERWNSGHLPVPRLGARLPELPQSLVGWAALSPTSSRECYCGVAEVSVYIADGYRGQGIGRCLLYSLIHASEEAGIWTLQAAAFSNTRPARLLLSQGIPTARLGERIARLNVSGTITVL